VLISSLLVGASRTGAWLDPAHGHRRGSGGGLEVVGSAAAMRDGGPAGSPVGELVDVRSPACLGDEPPPQNALSGAALFRQATAGNDMELLH